MAVLHAIWWLLAHGGLWLLVGGITAALVIHAEARQPNPTRRWERP